MTSFNKLLSRQLHKLYGDHVPEELIPLLSVISESYDHYDKDRRMLERSIMITSEEMISLNAQLRMETELSRKAHDEMKSLFDKIEEVFFSVDISSGRLTQISSACLRIYGWEQATFERNPNLWLDVIYKDDAEVKNRIRNGTQAGEKLNLEYRIRHANNSVRWVATKITPTLDESGKLVHIDGVTTDITARKKAEQEHEAVEKRFRALIENSADMLAMYDGTGNLIYCSPSVEKISGFSLEERLSKPIVDFTHPDDFDKVTSVFADVTRTPGMTLPLTIRQKFKDGRWAWLEGTVTNQLLEPAVNAIVCNYRDVTERKFAEEALRKSEDQFRSLFENARDPILLLDENQQFIDCNEATVKILGATSKEEIIYKLPANFSPEYQPDGQTSREKSMEMDRLAFTNGSSQFEWVHKRIDGSLFFVDVSLTAVPHGDSVILLVHWRDITERKQSEERLAKQNAELQKTNAELDKFVYSVSHDLRAPLSSILGVIEIMADDTTDEIQLEQLKMLEQSISKLDGFIVDILNYSRNSRLTVEKENVDLGELIADIRKNLAYMAGGNHRPVSLNIDIPPNCTVLTDRTRIAIVLNNLVANAIRYQDPDSNNPLVNISVDLSDTETNIIVRDNGIGISRENHEKIFDMFYRVSNQSNGSGLGLYIVKEIVDKLNGKIEVESEPGRGSAFKIAIPK